MGDGITKILIIGFGNFGKAILHLLNKDNCHEIHIYNRSQVADLKGVNKIYNNLEAALGQNSYNYIFLCTTSNAVESIAKAISNSIKNKEQVTVISCIKGLHNAEYPFITDYIKTICDINNLSFIGGPGFATDILNNKQTIFNIASQNTSSNNNIIQLFSKSNAIFEIDTDIRSLQLWGALKNVLAIYVGYLTGKNYSINEIIVFILQFINECKQFFDIYSANFNNFLSPVAFGDIMLTCISEKSRNRSFGMMLSKHTKHIGLNIEINSLNNIEGLHTLTTLYSIQQNKKISCRTLNKIFNLVQVFLES